MGIVLGLALALSASAQQQQQGPAEPPWQTVPARRWQDPLPPSWSEEIVVPPSPGGVSAAAHVGFWLFPKFEATIPGGSREFTGRAFLEFGFDLTVPFDPGFLLVSGEYGASGELEVFAAAAHLGLRLGVADVAGVPLDLRLSGGPVFAKLDVNESRFGDFDDGIGASARAEFAFRLPAPLAFSVWGEARWVELDFQETVIGGDESAGGLTFAAGLSLSLRF